MLSFLNPAVRRDGAYRGIFPADVYRSVDAFYDARPALAPTPLRGLDGLTAALGLGGLLVKDESARFGLSAFKSLGARYAMERIGRDALAAGVVCATAGNHGRAVARAARDLDVPCVVFVPALPVDARPEERATRSARVAGAVADGATIVEVDGPYEEAVERAAAHAAATGAVIVSDTAWPGYEAIPMDIMAGYTRLFSEASRQWTERPDAIVVQGGVGGLVAAGASWLAFHHGPARPFLIACEPDGYACLMASAMAGGLARASDERSTPTMMAGLRCAWPSHAAWPAVRDGVDAFVSIPDASALEAMELLRAQPGDARIDAGPSGACGVGALVALASQAVLRDVRDACGLTRSARVMAIVTEGK